PLSQSPSPTSQSCQCPTGRHGGRGTSSTQIFFPCTAEWSELPSHWTYPPISHNDLSTVHARCWQPIFRGGHGWLMKLAATTCFSLSWRECPAAIFPGSPPTTVSIPRNASSIWTHWQIAEFSLHSLSPSSARRTVV